MSVEQNVELMREWFGQVWNKRNTDFVRKVLDKNVTGFGQDKAEKVVKGPEHYLDFVRRIHESFPDLKLTVEDAFGSGDKVAVRWSATMTHKGDAIGVPATNKRVDIWGIAIVVVRDGKIMEGWDSWDQAALLEQIGVYRREPAQFVA